MVAVCLNAVEEFLRYVGRGVSAVLLGRLHIPVTSNNGLSLG